MQALNVNMLVSVRVGSQLHKEARHTCDTYTDGSLAETRPNESSQLGVLTVEAYATLVALLRRVGHRA